MGPLWPLLAVVFVTAFIPSNVFAASPTARNYVSTKRPSGWLGVALTNHAGGTLIDNVVPGSPAQKVRLRKGDKLVRVGGTDVASAQNAAALISRHPSGAQLPIVIERRGVLVQVMVRLSAAPTREELFRMMLVGTQAPQLQGIETPITGEGVTLEQYRGRVLLLDFWASYCVACRMTTKQLNRWQQQYGPKGLQLLAIAPQPVIQTVRGASAFGIRYPVAADPDARTMQAYHVTQLPSVVLVDGTGRIVEVAAGNDELSMRRVENAICELLESSGSASNSRAMVTQSGRPQHKSQRKAQRQSHSPYAAGNPSTPQPPRSRH